MTYFVAVAEELHFGRAARRLGISQPPLSQQIKALEDELGVLLFRRTNRRVELTEPGRLFLIEVRNILQSATHAIDTARRADKGEVGELLIGMTASVPFVGTIPNTIAAFRRRYPDIRLTLREMPNPFQITALAEGRLHAGFIRGGQLPDLPTAIKASLLSEEPLVVAMRDDHPLASTPAPVTVRDLAQEDFVLYARGVGFGFHDQVVSLCHTAGFEPRVAQEVRELSTLLGFVTAGLGLTILPSSLQALHANHMVYRPLEAQGNITRMWLIHPRGHISETCKAFVAAITQMRVSARQAAGD